MSSIFDTIREKYSCLEGKLVYTINISDWSDIYHYLQFNGVHIIEINMNVSSKNELLFNASKAFGFDDYFAKNWDALNDSLTYFLEEFNEKHANELLAIILKCPHDFIGDGFCVFVDSFYFFSSFTFKSISNSSNENVDLFVVYMEK